MKVRGVVWFAPLVDPVSALITAQDARGDLRICVARPHSPTGILNQAAAPGRARTSSASLRARGRPPPLLPPGVRPRRCHCSLTSHCGPALAASLSPTSGFWRLRPYSLQSLGRAGLPPRPSRGCAPLRSPQLAFVIPAPFLASPPTPRRPAKHGVRVTATPGICSGRRAEVSPACVRVRARARARVSNPCCASADYDLELRVPHIMSGGLEERVWTRKGGRRVFVCVREREDKCTG